MSEHSSPLTLALDQLTVADVWKRLGLKGAPRPSCRSPFREDRNPSFSIYDHGRRWRDHATGESGDAVDFVAKACGLSVEDGAKRLIELAGTGKDKKSSNSKTHHAQSTPQEYDPFKDQQKTAKREKWPRFELPTQAEIETIAGLRGLSPDGVALPVEQGILYCADFRGARAWIVTDSRRVNAQARRLDAKPWEHDGSAKKAMSLLGSVGCWPIGLREAQNFPAIALLEGGPDLVTAFHFLWLSGLDSIAPIAILGASNSIAKPALPYFKGKVVRVFPHNDADGTGLAAAKLWAAQLMAAGAVVDGFSFAGLTQIDGSPVIDLNDFVRIDPDQWESQRSLVESAFDFVLATLTPKS